MQARLETGQGPIGIMAEPKTKPEDIVPGTTSERAQRHLEEIRGIMGDNTRIIPIKSGVQAIAGDRVPGAELRLPPVPSALVEPATETLDMSTADEIAGITQEEWEARHASNVLDLKEFRRIQKDRQRIKELQEVADSKGLTTNFTRHDGKVVQIKPASVK